MLISLEVHEDLVSLVWLSACIYYLFELDYSCVSHYLYHILSLTPICTLDIQLIYNYELSNSLTTAFPADKQIPLPEYSWINCYNGICTLAD